MLTIGSSPQDARAWVVLVHGRGGSARDMGRLAPYLETPDVTFVAPESPSGNGSWYPQRFLAPLEHNEPWLSAALREVDAAVEQGLAAGVPLARIGLVGFSQGACLALEYVIRRGQRLGFVAGLSGAMMGPLEQTPSRPAVDLAGTPILLSCADHDAHIPLPHVEATAAFVTAHGADLTTRIRPGYDHTIETLDVKWVRDQLQQLVT